MCKQMKKIISLSLVSLFFVAAVIIAHGCSVSYKFNGASIDYTKTKTIQINDFPIRSSYVWGPMGPLFNNTLKDQYANHTRLVQVKKNGDLKLEGEIVNYSQRNKSVSSEGYSAQTELTITVKQFSASQTYETTQSLNAVAEELVTRIIKDLVEQIFNATVANW